MSTAHTHVWVPPVPGSDRARCECGVALASLAALAAADEARAEAEFCAVVGLPPAGG